MGTHCGPAFDLSAVFACVRPVRVAGPGGALFNASGCSVDGQLSYRRRPGSDFPVMEEGRKICGDGASRHTTVGCNGLGNMGNLRCQSQWRDITKQGQTKPPTILRNLSSLSGYLGFLVFSSLVATVFLRSDSTSFVSTNTRSTKI